MGIKIILNKINYLIIALIVAILLIPIILWSGWSSDDSAYMLALIKFEPFMFIKAAFNGLSDRFLPLNNLSVYFISNIYFAPITFFIYYLITFYLSNKVYPLPWLYIFQR